MREPNPGGQEHPPDETVGPSGESPAARGLPDTTPLMPEHLGRLLARGDISERELRRGLESAPLPDHIGSYKVNRRLGVGGMGEVFLVFDESLGRQVALKRVRPDRSADELRRRFEVEARVTALLQHPSIIPVYDLTVEGKTAFYTMRPVDGQSLAQLLKDLEINPGLRVRWPMARLTRLFLQASNAVAYAHSQGVIHRDLKPSNIMIGRFEEVLVLDWGMAKIKRQDESEAPDLVEGETDAVTSDELDPLRELYGQTSAYTVLGTPNYMAPELFVGDAASEVSDVFALGVILYQLLTLEVPWPATTLGELRQAMRTAPPPPPEIVAPATGVSRALGDVVLRALNYEPERRYQSVAEFSSDVAAALEGRASWKLEGKSLRPDRWRIEQGRLKREGDEINLRSRGAGRSFRYFCTERFAESVSLEFEVYAERRAQLSIWLNASPARQHRPEEGYCLGVLPGRRQTLAIERSGREVGGGRYPDLEPRRWYRAVAKRERDHISVSINGEELYSYRDPIPLQGGFVGLTGQTNQVRVRNLRIQTLGTGATVSCLSIPDAFFNRSLFEEARAEYAAIARSLPDRSEGQMAHFRTGLCDLELARREQDEEIRELILERAEATFAQGEAARPSALMGLGRAIVAEARGDWFTMHNELLDALSGPPVDPERRTVEEWLLGKLHRVDIDKRQKVAAFVPLALRHSLHGWGAKVIQDVVRRARSTWETPSFLSGRGRLREADIASHIDAETFFSFWAGRPRPIEVGFEDLVESALVRPHHLSDAYFALVELREVEAAHELLEPIAIRLEEGRAPFNDPRFRAVMACCRAADEALAGDIEGAFHFLRSLESDSIEVPSRAFNSTRLTVARAAWDDSKKGRAREALRLRAKRDSFALEHLTWFNILDGDVKEAERSLRPFIDRSQHLAGRNLSNFLYGAILMLKGNEQHAQRVFRALPDDEHPRTWTLGSYLASGRIDDSDPEFLQGAFPWEKLVLASHRQLLESVGWTS